MSSKREIYWRVTLECIGDDGSRYLWEWTMPVSPRAGDPIEAVDSAMATAAESGETPCGIEEVRKFHD